MARIGSQAEPGQVCANHRDREAAQRVIFEDLAGGDPDRRPSSWPMVIAERYICRECATALRRAWVLLGDGTQEPVPMARFPR